MRAAQRPLRTLRLVVRRAELRPFCCLRPPEKPPGGNVAQGLTWVS